MISGGFVSAVASFNLCLQALLMIDLGLLLLRSGIPAGVYVRHTKDRMVCDGVPRWETAVINRAHAANRTCGLPITGDSRNCGSR